MRWTSILPGMGQGIVSTGASRTNGRTAESGQNALEVAVKNGSGATLRAVSKVVVMLQALVATTGCQLANDLLPRTHTTSQSPDGRYTAFVRQGASLDPPDDHLYLGPSGGQTRRLMDLAPDSDWCRTIIWTNDSRKVGFLIRDQRLAIFDTATGEQVAMLQLVLADGYPGSQGARRVVMGSDGIVSFERFQRAGDRPLGTEAVKIPRPTLSAHDLGGDESASGRCVGERARRGGG